MVFAKLWCVQWELTTASFSTFHENPFVSLVNRASPIN